MKFSDTSRKYNNEAARDAVIKHVNDIRVHLNSFLLVQYFRAPRDEPTQLTILPARPTFDVRLWSPRTGQEPWLDLFVDDMLLYCVVSPFASDSAYFIPLLLLQLPF